MFPSKHQWKNLLNKHVIMTVKKKRYERLVQHRSTGYGYIPRLGNPCELWTVLRNHPELRPCCDLIVSVVGRLMSRPYIEQCKNCLNFCNDIVDHTLNFCTKKCYLRQHVWDFLIADIGINFYSDWINQPRNVQLDMLLNITFDEVRKARFSLLRRLYHLFKTGH